MGRFPVVLSALFISAVPLAGCDEVSEPAVGSIENTQVIRRGNGGDPGTLDPALAEDVHAFEVLADLYEGLTVMGPTGATQPGTAESWDISENGLSYTFVLRSAAQWSNGDQVVAADFVRAFQRIASPDTLSVYSFLLEPLENFSLVKAGQLPISALGIDAVDERTLVLRLENPSPWFPSILSMPITFPLHPHAAIPDSFFRVDRFIGNGPFVLASSEANGPIRVRRNPTYWDTASVLIDEVEYLPIVNANTELNMYRSGELHISNTIPPDRVKQMRNSIPDEVRISPSLALYYLAFDLTEAPFNNAALREALSMAVDRNQLVSLIGRGEQPAYGIVPPGVANHVQAEYAWRNADPADRIAQARILYAAAGYNRETPLSIKLTYDVGDIHERVALAVSSMWFDALGVQVVLDKKEWKFFLDSREDRPSWQIMRFSWFGDYNDPMTFAEIFRSDSPQNLAKYESTQFDDILNRAASELDPSIRLSLMTKAEATLLLDHPIIPLYFYVSKHLVKPNIIGFEDNVLDRHPSKYLSLAPVE